MILMKLQCNTIPKFGLDSIYMHLIVNVREELKKCKTVVKAVIQRHSVNSNSNYTR